MYLLPTILYLLQIPEVANRRIHNWSFSSKVPSASTLCNSSTTGSDLPIIHRMKTASSRLWLTTGTVPNIHSFQIIPACEGTTLEG
jgi:hypothetical protein